MDEQTVNEQPYHEGGKHGPGQEVYYSIHRIRLWEWFCKTTSTTPFNLKDTSVIYKKKKEVLHAVCQSLGVATDGTNKVLTARLDRYEFTPEQRQQLNI